MPIPAAVAGGLSLAGKLLNYGSIGLLADELTGKNIQRLLTGTPEGQRNYTVDAQGNYQPRRNTETKTKQEPQKERSFFEKFLFGTPQAERNYTVNAAGEYQAQVPPGGPIRPDRETPNINPVTTENGQITTPINLSAPKPDPKLAPTPAENAGAMDPYAYQLQVYGQGRQAAASQQAQAAVRDLGLSIHQKLYPQFYADKENIPTTDAQLPNSMNMKDANAELYASTLAVEELIDPKILQQLNAMNLRKTGY